MQWVYGADCQLSLLLFCSVWHEGKLPIWTREWKTGLRCIMHVNAGEAGISTNKPSQLQASTQTFFSLHRNKLSHRYSYLIVSILKKCSGTVHIKPLGLPDDQGRAMLEAEGFRYFFSDAVASIHNDTCKIRYQTLHRARHTLSIWTHRRSVESSQMRKDVMSQTSFILRRYVICSQHEAQKKHIKWNGRFLFSECSYMFSCLTESSQRTCPVKCLKDFPNMAPARSNTASDNRLSDNEKYRAYTCEQDGKH